MNKIGVFGGSFDPVHYGHIYLVKQAIAECGLDRAIVMPAAVQPFKPKQANASGVHRLHMANLAFRTDDNIAVSDFEINRGGVSYTIDALREIGRLYGSDAEISFILGADTFLKIEKWMGFEDLINCYSFIIGMRPGYKQDELTAFLGRLARKRDVRFTLINNRRIPVSSTEIKQVIKSGGSLSKYLPAAVERYITAHGLYQ